MAVEKSASEAVFMSQVLQIADMNGWKVQHVQPMKSSRGNWMTGGSPGYPDLTMAHPTKGFLMAELKTMDGRLSVSQVLWANYLKPHVEYYVWRPNMLELIAERLGRSSIPK